jgi:hypothetical protein
MPSLDKASEYSETSLVCTFDVAHGEVAAMLVGLQTAGEGAINYGDGNFVLVGQCGVTPIPRSRECTAGIDGAGTA